MTVTFDADLAERPYRALVQEYDGGRVWLTVRAIGPKGAEHTALQTALDKGYDVSAVLKVEEVRDAA